MNTIFWLSVVFGSISFVALVAQIVQLCRLSEFERMFVEAERWPVMTLIFCVVVAVTL